MVPVLPTVTNNPVELVKTSSLLLLQEMKMELKRNMDKMKSICLTRFPISGLGKPKLYQNLWDFTRMWGLGRRCEFLTWWYFGGVFHLI